MYVLSLSITINYELQRDILVFLMYIKTVFSISMTDQKRQDAKFLGT